MTMKNNLFDKVENHIWDNNTDFVFGRHSHCYFDENNTVVDAGYTMVAMAIKKFSVVLVAAVPC